MNNFYFSVGPAQIHPMVEFYSKQFYELQLGSISHRSEAFRKVYQKTVDELKLLMNIPNDFSIFFLSSASEIFERIILNCINENSFHLVNGAFSKKFYIFAKSLNKNAEQFEKPFGNGFDLNEIIIPNHSELICVTQNETSTGVALSQETIKLIKLKYPNKLMAVDIVSSAPYINLDYSYIDMSFFSVQKAFGLPAGLGVWIIKHDVIERLISSVHKKNVGAQNTLADLQKNYLNFETPSTPNIYNIYLLGNIAAEMNKKGVHLIREETDAKAKMLYDFLNKSTLFSAFVADEKFQSKTVVVANCPKNNSTDIIKQLKQSGLVVSSGYGNFKEQHLRIANFPAIPIIKVEELISKLKQL